MSAMNPRFRNPLARTMVEHGAEYLMVERGWSLDQVMRALRRRGTKWLLALGNSYVERWVRANANRRSACGRYVYVERGKYVSSLVAP